MESAPMISNTKFGKPRRPKIMPQKKIKTPVKFAKKACPKGHSVCSCH